MNNPYNWIDRSLATINKANWYRSVKKIDSIPDAIVKLLGKDVINFASNDYLGLAGDNRLIKAAIEATIEYGTGSTGSRLLSGHRELHERLEKDIALLKNTESALVFSSGYLANLGTISALVGTKDLILGDIYNHSSLKNGAKLSGAKWLDYLHLDTEDLKYKLVKNRSLYRRCLIITDSVFSMDGDICPLPELISIARQFECMLLVDEAHATGVMGETGSGCVEHFKCDNKNLIQIGTLSKAVGSLGGYVAGNNNLIDYLRNRAATWIYTTALSPADTAAAITGIKIINEEPERRKWLWNNVNYFKKKLSSHNLLFSESAIICLGFNSPETALKKSQELQEAGIFAPAIRPPTVPTSRIRFSLMATHKLEHIDRLAATLNK